MPGNAGRDVPRVVADGVRIAGLSRLRRDLVRLGVDAQDFKVANAAAAQTVIAAAAPRAPRATGRLAGSLRAARAAGRARVTSAVPYATVQHWHPSYGRAFVSEAAQATEPIWLAAYVADLDRFTGKIAGKSY